ncbi:hypothetical protein LR49_00070 [Staphylococcus aureus]|nr:hypothetical protein LR49_00070 [Staphylococcus aureus]REL23034.1 hypothetical protein DY400_10845 [Staphylococcus aureus]
MFLSLKTLYRKRTVIWPFYFYTIIRTLSNSIGVFLYIDKISCLHLFYIILFDNFLFIFTLSYPYLIYFKIR